MLPTAYGYEGYHRLNSLVAESVKGKIVEAMRKGDFRLKMVIMQIVLSRGNTSDENSGSISRKMWDQYGLSYSASAVTNRDTNSIKELVGVNLLCYQSELPITVNCYTTLCKCLCQLS